MWTEPKFSDRDKIKIREFIEIINSRLLESTQRKTLLSFGNKIERVCILDCVRVLSEVSPNNSLERVVKNSLLEMSISAESTKPGGSIFSLLSFCNFFLSKQKFNEEEFYSEIYKCSAKSYRSDLKGLIDQIKQISDDNHALRIFMKIIDGNSFNSSISVSEWSGNETKIEQKTGSRFAARVSENFLMATRINEWNGYDVSCIVIDGVIERVSEIHHLLESFSNSKKSLCIFARGYGEEVIATLASNYVRKTLKCVPFVIDINMSTINTLKDISVVANFNMISSMKGDIISSISEDDIAIVDSVSSKNGETTIFNFKNEEKINYHINFLRKKLEEEKEQDVCDLIEKRIMSLSPHIFSISLGSHLGEMRGLYKDRLNQLIGISNAICLDGIIKTESLESSIIPLIKTAQILEMAGFKSVPASSFFEGIKIGFITSQNLKKTTGFIVVDND
tara:strand:- start:119 stop:1468 length:1350 start_codon:yes stop_codon:yes gene_type:complete